MALQKLRIAIVGCGTAGPAAAVLLKRQGHEVVLFERAPECKAVGAGFLLQPSGMAVLEELGIMKGVPARLLMMLSMAGQIGTWRCPAGNASVPRDEAAK